MNLHAPETQAAIYDALGNLGEIGRELERAYQESLGDWRKEAMRAERTMRRGRRRPKSLDVPQMRR